MPADKLQEWWDIYDINEHKIGQCQRGDNLNVGQYHLVVNAFIFDLDVKVLLQQRSFEKITGPGVWECSVGGSVLVGEDVMQAMVREIKEELGLDIGINQLSKFDHRIDASWIEYWFLVQSSFTLADVTIQAEEVAQAKLVSLNTAQQMIALTADGIYLQELNKAVNQINIR